MKEQWKDIKGYEGIYQASNKGNIKGVEGRTTFTKRHGIRTWKENIMKFRGSNYQTGNRVTLWKNGKSKEFLVARLVAFTFYEKDIKNRKLTVNHIDGNRLNNNINNLELVSMGDNIRHAFETGLQTNQIKTIVKNTYNNKIKTYRSMALAERENNISAGIISLYKKRYGNNFSYMHYEIEVE